MKKLFTNYNFEFDKNEKKLLISFSRQVVKQMEGQEKFFSEVRAFNSVIDKLQDNSADTIKLTKDERTRLVNQLEENVKYLNKKISSGWFFTKWIYKSLFNNYKNLLEKHFKG
jgi:hypothetical protein